MLMNSRVQTLQKTRETTVQIDMNSNDRRHDDDQSNST